MADRIVGFSGAVSTFTRKDNWVLDAPAWPNIGSGSMDGARFSCFAKQNADSRLWRGFRKCKTLTLTLSQWERERSTAAED